MAATSRPHVVLMPFPAQSHIKAFLKFGKLLHHRGFHITFVNTEFNHDRFVRSQGSSSVNAFPDFRFEAIPDGLPPSNPDATQNLFELIRAVKQDAMAPPLVELLRKLNAAASAAGSDGAVPPVTCVVADGFMPFALGAARELRVPGFSLFTVSATTLMCMKFYDALRQKGLTPLKDESYLTNGYLETTIDWIPGIKDIRLRDLSSFVRTTDPSDLLLEYLVETAERVLDASAIIFLTLEALEPDVLNALSSIYSQIYAIGPLQPLLNEINQEPLGSAGYSLWKEDEECLKWLDRQEADSVLYINFGSIVVMTRDQLTEFATGLVESNCPFLWVIRPDLIEGENRILPETLAEQVRKGRGFIASWCGQEEVLNHKSINGFVTHCGWNSIIESLTAGVPMLCWPCIGDQQTNAWLVCRCLGVAFEVEGDAKHQEVTRLVKELVDGETGKEIRRRIKGWKRLVHEAASEGGASRVSFDRVVDQILTSIKN